MIIAVKIIWSKSRQGTQTFEHLRGRLRLQRRSTAWALQHLQARRWVLLPAAPTLRLLERSRPQNPNQNMNENAIVI